MTNANIAQLVDLSVEILKGPLNTATNRTGPKSLRVDHDSEPGTGSGHRKDAVVERKRSGTDGYDAVAPAKAPKGERAAMVQYLEPDEVVWLRQPAEIVGETEGRVLLEGGVVVLVTDRKMVAARTPGGFRPRWEVFTLPFGHLEPGVGVGGIDGTDVAIPTSGRRSYCVGLSDVESAKRLAASLGDALRTYRRDRMGLNEL